MSVFDSVTERNITTRADQLGCLQPPPAQRSGVNFDGIMIDFLSDTVLGLPNPLEFEVTADRWKVRNIQCTFSPFDYSNLPTGHWIVRGCY